MLVMSLHLQTQAFNNCPKNCTRAVHVLLFKGIFTNAVYSSSEIELSRGKTHTASGMRIETEAPICFKPVHPFTQTITRRDVWVVLDYRKHICTDCSFSWLLHTHIETNILISSLKYYSYGFKMLIIKILPGYKNRIKWKFTKYKLKNLSQAPLLLTSLSLEVTVNDLGFIFYMFICAYIHLITYTPS